MKFSLCQKENPKFLLSRGISKFTSFERDHDIFPPFTLYTEIVCWPLFGNTLTPHARTIPVKLSPLDF